MKKTVYLSILTIATMVCILVGIAIHVIGGGLGSLFGFGGKNTVDEGSTTSYAKKVDAFTAIDMDLAAVELNIETGDDYAVDYQGISDLRPQVKMDGQKLVIKGSGKKVHFTPKMECKLTVTMPDGVKLSQVNLDIDAGDVEIRNMNAEKLSIDVDAGNIEIYDGSFADVSVDVDAGNVSFENCLTQNVKADADLGNIEWKHCTFDTIIANADMGNVEAHSSQSLQEYKMNFEVDLGNIDVFGKSYSDNYRADGDASKYIEISVNLGNITVDEN